MTVYYATTRNKFLRALNDVQFFDPLIRCNTTDAGELNQSNLGPVIWVLADDGDSGFGLRELGGGEGWELIALFSARGGRGFELMNHALNLRPGARVVLNCFDGYLPTFYARYGFVETHRETNYTPGGPDVVFMVREAS